MSKRVAVVTGSNKGIGLSIVKALCQKFDGDVYLTARDTGRGEAAVAELQKLGVNPKFHQLDIDDQSSINRLKEFLVKEYQGLDVLVNNAGMAYKMDSTAPVAEQAENTVKTNFFSTLNVCRTLFPLLRPHARVVNVSSSMGMLKTVPGPEIQAKLSAPMLTEEELCSMANEYTQDAKSGTHIDKGWPKTTYGSSKVFLSALSFIQHRAFEQDPREDIVLNVVHPGYVDTDMTSHKGPLTPDQGADAPSYLALLPSDVKEPKGQMVWFDRKVVNWVEPFDFAKGN
jgi:carbonyl reductase 1